VRTRGTCARGGRRGGEMEWARWSKSGTRRKEREREKGGICDAAVCAHAHTGVQPREVWPAISRTLLSPQRPGVSSLASQQQIRERVRMYARMIRHTTLWFLARTVCTHAFTHAQRARDACLLSKLAMTAVRHPLSKLVSEHGRYDSAVDSSFRCSADIIIKTALTTTGGK